jgi:hypothetical protein
MVWLALNRALRIDATHRTPARQVTRWETQRAAVAVDVTTRGFDPERNTYTRTYGSSDRDAALLVLPHVGLEPLDSPRMRGTIDAIRHDLSAGGPLLYRYPPGTDGLPLTFQPHLTGGITGQISAIGVGQQRPQMQSGDLVLDVQMHHHRGVLPVRPGSHLGVPAGVDQTQERRTGVR